MAPGPELSSSSSGAANKTRGHRRRTLPSSSSQPSAEAAAAAAGTEEEDAEDPKRPTGRCCGGGGDGGSSSRRAAGRSSSSSGGGGGGGGGCCDRCVDRCAACTATLTRICLIIPNFVFLLFGGALIGLGVLMKADRESSFYLDVLRVLPVGPLVTFDRVPVIIIAVGSCVAILSFLGCCGACAESICFLCLYMLFIVVVLITEIVLAIVIVVLRNQILLKLEYTMQNQIRYEYNASDLERSTDNRTFNHVFTDAWNKMQDELSCCGAAGPEDYADSAWYNRTTRAATEKKTKQVVVVPVVCCNQMTRECQDEAARYIKNRPLWRLKDSSGTNTALKTQGCRESMSELIRQNLTLVIGIVCSVAMFQVADFVFACVLMHFVRKKQESWYDDDDIIDYANNDCGE